MENKNYKISVMVNKENYLKLRANLLLSEQSFSSWVNEAINDSLARNRKMFAQRPERDSIPLVK
ncbi:MAG TPA: hypothetical protein VF303_04350 [Candidatus Nanoarchaeia archaeon]